MSQTSNDTLFVNGRFIDPACGVAAVGDALLARGPCGQAKIVAVGAAAVAAQAAADAKRVDLKGATVVPGLVDCHVHLQGLGNTLTQCDLSGAADKHEVLERLRAFAAAHPEAGWIAGRGYDLNEVARGSRPHGDGPVNREEHGQDARATNHGQDAHATSHGQDARATSHGQDARATSHGQDARATSHGQDARATSHGQDARATSEEYPTADELDEAVSDRPCVAMAFDGHSMWANSKAMSVAGFTAARDPQGGKFVRDSEGRPTGYLLESAVDLMRAARPWPTSDEVDRILRYAVDHMVATGHTAVHACLEFVGQAAGMLERLQRLYPDDACPLRIRIFGSFGELDRLAELHRQSAGRRVQVSGVKCMYDGSLGSRTAWMFEPYGSSRTCGMATLAAETLREMIAATNGAGLPLICHAIGDRACAEALEAFGKAGDRGIGNRIEHAQHIRPADIELFAPCGVAASVQPSHLGHDWKSTDELLDAGRAACTHVYRSLLECGAVLAVGSDTPVVPPDPADSLRAAVMRTDASGNPPGGWHSEQCITPMQWLAAATCDAWRSISEPGRRGRLIAGEDCDLTVLGGRPFDGRDLTLAPLYTVTGGSICRLR